MEPSGHGSPTDHSGRSRRARERETSPEYERARLERLEGGQRNLTTAITGLQATLHQLSVDSAETRRMVQHVGERLDHLSTPSRHARSRDEERHEEEPPWADRRRGGRIEGRGIEVERWLGGADRSIASDGRNQGHHDGDSDMSDRERPMFRRRPYGGRRPAAPRPGQRRYGDGADRGERDYQGQRLRKPKINFSDRKSTRLNSSH